MFKGLRHDNVSTRLNNFRSKSARELYIKEKDASLHTYCMYSTVLQVLKHGGKINVLCTCVAMVQYI